MTDHAFDRAELAEAVGNDIADMAHFWMLRKFQFLEPAREQFEIIVDPWLSYCEEPSQNEIMAYNMAFTDWLLFERPYRHGKTLLELYVDEPPASLSPASLKRLERVRDTQYFSRFGILDKNPASGMVVLKDTRTDRRFDVYDRISCRRSIGTTARLRCASPASTMSGLRRDSSTCMTSRA